MPKDFTISILSPTGDHVHPASEITLQAVLDALAKDTSIQSILTAVAKEATIQTLASETTLQSILTAIAKEVTLQTLASETTLLTRSSEATLLTRASESTLQAILSATPVRKTVCIKLAPVTVGTTSTIVANTNTNRLGFTLLNGSNLADAYITLGETSIIAECSKLVTTFGTWEGLWPLAYTGPISAIRVTGSGPVTIYEFVAI